MDDWFHSQWGAAMARSICGTWLVVLTFVAMSVSAQAQVGSAVPVGKAGETHLVPPKLPQITPPALADEVATLKLPAPVKGTAIGGGGRYLFFHLGSLRKLAVFDVNVGKITQYVALGSDDVAFTASADKLIVVLRDQKIIQRWSLETFERELAKTIAVEHSMANALMGSASNGPIFLAGGDYYRNSAQFLDLTTLEPSAIALQSGRMSVGGGSDCVVRASGDGRVFTMWRIGTSPSGLQDIVVTNNTAQVRYEHDSVGDILPSPDGKLLYTGTGIFTNELKRVGTRVIKSAIPSVHGDFYLLPAYNKGGEVSVHMSGDERPLVNLPDVFSTPEDRWGGDRSPAALSIQRLYYIPDANLIVTLPHTNDQLIVRRFNLDEVLAKSDIDYLFVASRPRVTAERGKPYTYSVRVKSKRGGVKYQLAAGPTGMTISTAGVVNWTAPASYADKTADVLLSVSDASGQEVFQNFSLELSGAAAPVAAVTPPVTPPNVALPRPIGLPSRTATLPNSTTGAPATAVAPVGSAPTTVASQVSLPKIDPIALTEDKATVKLPATFGDVAVAGGGRYLVLHLTSLRQLAIFDICQARVVKYLPMASDDISFTGGGDRIIVSLRDKKLLQRWNLATFERELAISAPTADGIASIHMGHASSGPVMIRNSTDRHSSSISFLDGASLQPLATNYGKNPYGRQGLQLNNMGPWVRVSSDGRLFLMGGDAVAVNGMTVEQKTSHAMHPGLPHDAMPNADGSVLYSSSSLLNGDIKPLGSQKPAGTAIPSLQPGYYVVITATDNYSRATGQGKPEVSIHAEGEARPLVTLDVPAAQSMVGYGTQDPIPLQKRFYFVPDAQALIQLPATNDQLLVYKVDIDKELAKSEIDFLFVGSQPPRIAQPGKTLDYQIKVKSKRGGVKYEIPSPVPGLAISPTGLLRWAVPNDFAQTRQEIIVNVKDDSGQEVFHSFAIALPDVAVREQARLAAEAERMQQEQKARQAALVIQQDAARATEMAGRLARAPQAREAMELAAQKILTPPPTTPPPPQPLRTWTDTDGNQVEARFVQSFAGFVTLRKESNSDVTAIANRLSAEDQEYVRKMTEATIAERKAREAEKNTPEALAQNSLRIVGSGFHRSLMLRTRPVPLYNADIEGKPMLSWRVHLLPHVGGQELYDLFRTDQPWDSDHNKQLIKYMPSFYKAYGSKANEGQTNFLAVHGPDCFFNGPNVGSLARVPDGISKTAAIVEVPDTMAVIWTKPEDVEYAGGASIRQLFGLRKGGLNVILLDGSVKLLSPDNPDQTLEWLFLPKDGNAFDLK